MRTKTTPDLRNLKARVPGGQFSPRSIPGLKFWFDAADLSTLTITSSPDVDAARDKASNISLVQGTAAAKPEVGTTVNGRNALSFDGVDDNLRIGSKPFNGNSGRVFAVVRFPGSVPVGSNGNIFASGASSGAPYVSMLRLNVNAGSLYAGIRTQSNGVRGGTALTADRSHIISSASDGAAWSLRLNGAAETLTVISGSNTGHWLNDFGTADNLTLGWLDISGVAAFFQGLICEVLYYEDVTLTAAQIAQVERYLAQKWGGTLA